jgi:predicted Zn-dependent peptidase
MTRAPAALLAAAALARVAAAAPEARAIGVVQERLANGLTIVLAPDRGASAVVVEVRYDVGAADEVAEQAGFAHLAERLLFGGTARVADYDARIDAVGGWTSSDTGLDHVRVLEQVPPGALELAIWLEAERMANLASSLDAAKLAAATAAIAGERRSAYDDHPYALVARAVQQALWNSEPNAHLVLADPHATVAAVAAFVRQSIVPAHARLVIAGNFDATRAATQARRLFGGIAGSAGAAPAMPTPPRPLARPVTARVADPIAKAVVAFRAPDPSSDDGTALEVAAHILAGGRTSWLGRELERAGLASDVHVELANQRRGSELHVIAIAKDGVDPGQLVGPIDRAIARLREAPLAADEVAGAVAALELETALALEALPYRADALALEPTAGDLAPRRARLHAVTAAAIQRAAAAWLAAHAAVTVLGTESAP